MIIPNSFNLYNVAGLFSNRTGGNGVQVGTENDKFTVTKNKALNLVISRCCLVEYGEEMY